MHYIKLTSSCANTCYFPCSYNPSLLFSLNHIFYSSAFLISSSFLFGPEYFFRSAWKLHSFLLTYWFKSRQHQYHLWVWGTLHDGKKPIYIPISSNSSYGVRPSTSSKTPVPWAEFGKNYKCLRCQHWCREIRRSTYWPPPLSTKSMAGAATSSRLEAHQLWTWAWQMEDPASVLYQRQLRGPCYNLSKTFF